MGFDIIVLAGQSNADGSGAGEVAVPYEQDERILHMYDTQNIVEVLNGQSRRLFDIKPAEERIYNGGRVGNFALSFAREYIKAGLLEDKRKVLILHTAVGGTGFASKQWGVGDVLQERLIAMTDKALGMEKPKIIAFLWHQGEQDVVDNPELDFEGRKSFYGQKLEEMISDFRVRYGHVPFLAGEFVDEWKKQHEEACNAILAATKECCLRVGDAVVVSSKGLLSNNQKNGGGDTIHFCRQALYEYGQRYFKTYCSHFHNRCEGNFEV